MAGAGAGGRGGGAHQRIIGVEMIRARRAQLTPAALAGNGYAECVLETEGHVRLSELNLTQTDRYLSHDVVRRGQGGLAELQRQVGRKCHRLAETENGTGNSAETNDMA